MVEQNAQVPQAQMPAQTAATPMAKPVGSVQPMTQTSPAGNPGMQPVQSATPGTEGMAEKKSIFKKWWFWLIIALGVIIIGVGGWWIFLK